MSSTPRTDALFERHCKEAQESMPQFVLNGMSGANELALRQVKELLEHARKLEAEIEEHNAACAGTFICPAPDYDLEVEPFDETNEAHIESACNGMRFDGHLLDIMVALRAKDAEALLLAAQALRTRLKDSYEDNV